MDIPKSILRFLVLCVSLLYSSAVHASSLRHVADIEIPVFQSTTTGVPIPSLSDIFHTNSTSPRSIILKAFGTKFNLVLTPYGKDTSLVVNGVKEEWKPRMFSGYVRSYGPRYSDIHLSYVPAANSLTGFLKLSTLRPFKIRFDQVPQSGYEGNSDLLQGGVSKNQNRLNIVYKMKNEEVPISSPLSSTSSSSGSLHFLNLQKRGGTAPVSVKVNLKCPVVVIADSSFQEYYGSRTESYIQEMYNLDQSFYQNELGLDLELNRIVRSNLSSGTNPISTYLSSSAQMVSSSQIDARTTTGTKPCLVHLVTFTSFQPALGLAYIGPQPPPLATTSSTNANAVVDTSEVGGACASNGYNMFITTLKSGNSEVPQETARITTLHETGHTLGSSHRDQCCVNPYYALGITQQNMDPLRQQWAENAINGCKQSEVIGANGVPEKDIMDAQVEIGTVEDGVLGWCVRGMIWRFLLTYKDSMVQEGCLIQQN